MHNNVPPLIFITGTDGAGKSCLSEWLVGNFRKQGLQADLVWSRYNNFFSKPLLGLSRLTHHNYYRTIDGILFGFHNFRHLHGYRHLFALLQAFDVNLAVLRDIRIGKRRFDTLVCERGPWDTLVDVIVDTGIENLADPIPCRLFTIQVLRGSIVILINRSRDNILKSRPELVHDYSLDRKIDLYYHLAQKYGWFIVDNNESLATTKRQICRIFGIEVTE
jgi:hypothetical protein